MIFISKIIELTADPVIILLAILAGLLSRGHISMLFLVLIGCAALTLGLDQDPISIFPRFFGCSILSYVVMGIKANIKERKNRKKIRVLREIPADEAYARTGVRHDTIRHLARMRGAGQQK